MLELESIINVSSDDYAVSCEVLVQYNMTFIFSLYSKTKKIEMAI